jgi:hypothetical protein
MYIMVYSQRRQFRSLGGLGEQFGYLRDLNSLRAYESHATILLLAFYRVEAYSIRLG